MSIISGSRVVEASINWWKGLRPEGMTEEEYKANPTAGTVTLTDRDLALKVVEFLDCK
jgi:hypothetical protein